jgi:hypothetical protein
MILTSAYRPAEYQEHLREVWDKWSALRNNNAPECRNLKATVRAEYIRHQLLDTQRPAPPNGQHTVGNAFDATISGLPPGETQDTVADFCNMRRPFVRRDPVHYQPQ